RNGPASRNRRMISGLDGMSGRQDTRRSSFHAPCYGTRGNGTRRESKQSFADRNQSRRSYMRGEGRLAGRIKGSCTTHFQSRVGFVQLREAFLPVFGMVKRAVTIGTERHGIVDGVSTTLGEMNNVVHLKKRKVVLVNKRCCFFAIVTPTLA